MTDRIKLLLLVATFGLLGHGSAMAAEQFRVENRVFVGDEKAPRIESTTLFCNNVAYDYLAKPEEITVFDKNHDRFLLLDVHRRVKTEVSTAQVHEFTERLRQWASSQPDAFLKFLVDPRFEEQADDATSEMTFSSPWLTYRVVATDAESEEMVRTYTEFSNWYGQLNTLLNPGTRPPFARMRVNAVLESRQLFPQEVHLTVRTKDSLLAKRVTIRSEHQVSRHLIQSDRDRLTQTDQYIAMFSPIRFEDYQKKVEK
jgi:hypothetical protein